MTGIFVELSHLWILLSIISSHFLKGPNQQQQLKHSAFLFDISESDSHFFTNLVSSRLNTWCVYSKTHCWFVSVAFRVSRTRQTCFVTTYNAAVDAAVGFVRSGGDDGLFQLTSGGVILSHGESCRLVNSYTSVTHIPPTCSTLTVCADPSPPLLHALAPAQPHYYIYLCKKIKTAFLVHILAILLNYQQSD